MGGLARETLVGQCGGRSISALCASPIMSNISRNHLADAPLMRRVPEEANMGRAALLWLIGIPIPIILLVWLLGGLH